MVTLLRASVVALLMLPGIISNAQECQSWVDITMVPNETGQLEVWIRPQSYFGGFFAAMSFTIRWFEGDGASLGSVQMQVPYFGIAPSGPTHVDGIYQYQIYSGFNTTFDTLGSANLNAAWQPGVEVLLALINVNGNSYFQIIEDDWTGEIMNNGDYYISLNGAECQGDIYSFTTHLPTVTSDQGVTISPNPSSGEATITVNMAGQSDLMLDLMDASGRSVWNRSLPERTGQHVEQFRSKGLADGVYMLQVRRGGSISYHRMVLAGAR